MQPNPHGFVLQSTISKRRLVPRTIALNTNCRSQKKQFSLDSKQYKLHEQQQKNPRYFMQQTDHATFNVKKNIVWRICGICVMFACKRFISMISLLGLVLLYILQLRSIWRASVCTNELLECLKSRVAACQENK